MDRSFIKGGLSMTVLERVQAEIRASAEQRDAAERAFCQAWVDSGQLKATAGDLLEYAEKAGLEISGQTGQAKLISLGRWLGSWAGGPIKGEGATYRITPAKKRDGYTQWQISVEPEQ
jgi:hypothetical protein